MFIFPFYFSLLDIYLILSLSVFFSFHFLWISFSLLYFLSFSHFLPSTLSFPEHISLLSFLPLPFRFLFYISLSIIFLLFPPFSFHFLCSYLPSNFYILLHYRWFCCPFASNNIFIVYSFLSFPLLPVYFLHYPIMIFLYTSFPVLFFILKLLSFFSLLPYFNHHLFPSTYLCFTHNTFNFFSFFISFPCRFKTKTGYIFFYVYW